MTDCKINFIKHKKKILLSTILIAVTAFCLIAVMPTTDSEAATGMATINIGSLGGSNANNSAASATESQWSYTSADRQLFLSTSNGNYTLTGTNSDLSIFTTPNVNMTLSNIDMTSLTNISTFGTPVIYHNGGTITLVGTNKIAVSGTDREGLDIAGPVATTITGDAGSSLEISSTDSYGIYGSNALIISGHADVTCTGGTSGIYSDVLSCPITVGADAKLTATGAEIGFYHINSLLLEVDGTASFKSTATGTANGIGIRTASNPLTIKGGGTVSAEGRNGGIAVGTLSIENCNVTAIGTNSRAIVSSGNILMNDAAVLTFTNGSPSIGGPLSDEVHWFEASDFATSNRVWDLTTIFLGANNLITWNVILTGLEAGSTGTIKRIVLVPAIAVTSIGLDALKVGVPVTGSVVYTLSNDTYVASPTLANFAVSGLPAGLTGGTIVRTSDTVVTVPITGTPTTANASSVNLTIPASIHEGNFTISTSAGEPTGTVTASAVAKGDGAAVSGQPTVNGSPTDTSISVIALTIPTNPGSQTVEYAISTTSGTTPATGWQAGTTFGSLSAGTTYYVYARSASTANYNAGPVQQSTGISTALTTVTFTAVQTGGTSGTANSTGIVLTFTPAVTGLTADKITITNGTGAVTKGTLSNSGATWTIALSSVTTQGDVTVSVANFGAYNVTTGPLTVAVYKNTAPPVVPPVNPPVTTTNVAFTAVQTGGSSGTATSTGIVLTFSQAVTGLAASNITITNGTGVVTKGGLTGSGSTYTIALTSVTTQGNVTVSVSNFGTFNITGGAKTVAVYAAPAKNYGVKDGAGGSWNQGSDQGLGITVGADSSKVIGVNVDDKQVPAGSYTVGNNASGDAVVTFKASYLETLTAGTHNVKILFADGSATTTMTVSPSDAGEGGGGSNMVMIAAGVIIVMLVIIVLVYLLVIRPKTK